MKQSIFIGLFISIVYCNCELNAQSPQLIMDIHPGSASSSIEDMQKVGDKVFFFANDGVHGIEPWVTDGTTEGTHIVKDIYEGPDHAVDFNMVQSMTDLNGTALFMAIDGTHGYELWKSDGTEEGTELVIDLNQGAVSSMYDNNGAVTQMQVMNDRAYFVAYVDNLGWEIWSTDGTAGGTYMVESVFPGDNYNDYPSMLTVLEDKLYFASASYNPEGGIYVTDGISTTTLTDAILVTNNPIHSNFFIEYDDYVYFGAGTEENIGQLWRTDGTPEGTSMFLDLGGSSGWDPENFHVFSNGFVFTADYNSDGVLFISDGTTGGTQPLLDENGDIVITGNVATISQAFVRAENKLYFRGMDGTWVTDGTSSGTRFLTTQQIAYYNTDARKKMTAIIGSSVVFAGDNLVMQSDGSVAGTTAILMDWQEPDIVIELNGKVLFSIKPENDVNEYGRELYSYEPQFVNGIAHERLSSRISVYPNPATAFLTIEPSNSFQNTGIMIFNSEGKLCVSLQNQSGNQIKIDIEKLPPGLYHLTIENNGLIETSKFILTD